MGPVLQGNVFSDDDGSGWSPGGPLEDFSPADYPPDVLLVYSYGSLYGGLDGVPGWVPSRERQVQVVQVLGLRYPAAGAVPLGGDTCGPVGAGGFVLELARLYRAT